MAQSKFFVTKSWYLRRTNNEKGQNSNSEPKKFSTCVPLTGQNYEDVKITAVYLALILCKEEDRENSANTSYRVMILLILSRREGGVHKLIIAGMQKCNLA